jgi:chromosome segregation ATPase
VERSKLDTAALALARRAKGLTAEITHFTPDTDPAGVNGALARIADLHSDAAQLSLAAAGVLDKYLSPLSTSLSGLRDTLKSHPLSATLRMQIDELKAEVQTRTRDLQMEKKRVLAAIRAGIEEEKARSSKLVKTAESERDAMQRSLGREQVARRVARTAAEERLAALEERLKSAEAALNVEKADREAMQATLTERTKLMRQYQAKVSCLDDIGG